MTSLAGRIKQACRLSPHWAQRVHPKITTMKASLTAALLVAAVAIFYVSVNAQGTGPPACTPSHHCWHCHTDCDCSHIPCNSAHKCWHPHTENGVTTYDCECEHMPCNGAHPCWHADIVNGVPKHDCDCDHIPCVNGTHPCFHTDECECDCSHPR